MSQTAPAEPLDRRLIGVTLDLLGDHGVEGLSLRRIARHAGVSHGAPLRHFPTLSALLSEVAAVGFRMLSERVETSAGALPPGAGARARLAEAGRAYVACAVENPGLFSLMFRPGELDVDNARFARESSAAFEQLVRHVRAAQDAGWQTARDTRVLAAGVWSAVHGLAMLWSQGAIPGVVQHARLSDVLEVTLELALGDQQGGAS